MPASFRHEPRATTCSDCSDAECCLFGGDPLKPKAYWTLITTESNHGIYARRPPSRPVTRQRRYCQQSGADTNENHQIRRLHFI